MNSTKACMLLLAVGLLVATEAAPLGDLSTTAMAILVGTCVSGLGLIGGTAGYIYYEYAQDPAEYCTSDAYKTKATCDTAPACFFLGEKAGGCTSKKAECAAVKDLSTAVACEAAAGGFEACTYTAEKKTCVDTASLPTADELANQDRLNEIAAQLSAAAWKAGLAAALAGIESLQADANTKSMEVVDNLPDLTQEQKDAANLLAGDAIDKVGTDTTALIDAVAGGDQAEKAKADEDAKAAETKAKADEDAKAAEAKAKADEDAKAAEAKAKADEDAKAAEDAKADAGRNLRA